MCRTRAPYHRSHDDWSRWATLVEDDGTGRQRDAHPDREADRARAAAAARVSDSEREHVSEVLGHATAAGYLQLDELDDRLTTAWKARTRAELDAVLGDLPPQWLREQGRREATTRARVTARRSLGPHLTSYLLTMLLLVVIWLVIGVTAGAWYPWPVWPALGWGIGLVSHARAARATSA
jgi:uncharacterized protein DUF1707/2TM domain-containing protein